MIGSVEGRSVLIHSSRVCAGAVVGGSLGHGPQKGAAQAAARPVPKLPQHAGAGVLERVCSAGPRERGNLAAHAVDRRAVYRDTCALAPRVCLSRRRHGLVPPLCPVLGALYHSGHAVVSGGPRAGIRAGAARDYSSLFSNSLVSTANADVSSSNNLNI